MAPETHWPELRVVICVVSDQKKDVSSTSGMHTTTETSTLFRERLRVVPQRMDGMEKAILAKDFESFGRITMMDSNSFHSVCLDTFPPIFYLNDISKRIITLIHKWNEASGRTMAAYTFDAGPNAVIYSPKENMPQLLKLLLHYFPPNIDDATIIPDKGGYVNKEQTLIEEYGVNPRDTEGLPTLKMSPSAKGMLKFILTKPGEGPIILRKNYI